ncbi:MAG: cytotoxic translational repressor of toxin-antitoxin stability system [Desulfovibrio sp.]|nr:cytotoxic translational repressor of toxin-antitoxin stability system [Desulfovibrio sp.]
MDTSWTVGISAKVQKQVDKLPSDIANAFYFLLIELKKLGPIRASWPHYGKLKGKDNDIHHCHLNKNKPIYVVIWKVLDKKIRIMEIKYAGTHENADYRRFN